MLEKKAQSGNFIDPLDDEGNSIPVTAGVYMKMKANGFETQLGDNPTIFPGSRSNTACSTGNQNDYYSTLNYNGFDIGYKAVGFGYINGAAGAETTDFDYLFIAQER